MPITNPTQLTAEQDKRTKWSHEYTVETPAGEMTDRMSVEFNDNARMFKGSIMLDGVVRNTGTSKTTVECNCYGLGLTSQDRHDAVTELSYYLLGLYVQLDEKLGIALARIDHGHQEDNPAKINSIIAGDYHMPDLNVHVTKTSGNDVKLEIGLDIKTGSIVFACETIDNKDRFDTVLHYLIEDLQALVCRLMTNLSHEIIDLGKGTND